MIMAWHATFQMKMKAILKSICTRLQYNLKHVYFNFYVDLKVSKSLLKNFACEIFEKVTIIFYTLEKKKQLDPSTLFPREIWQMYFWITINRENILV